MCICVAKERSKHDILASKACARCPMLGLKSYMNQEKLFSLVESQLWCAFLDLMFTTELVKQRPHP